MLIGDIAICNARLFPGKRGIVDEYVRLTWREVNDRSNRFANAMMKLGLTKGDRVAIISENRHEYAEFFFGTAKAALVGIPLNYRLTPAKLAYTINDSQPKAIVVLDKLVHIADEIRSQLKHVPEIIVIGESGNYEQFLASAPEVEPQVDVDEHDTCILQYTTGTTGAPKGIELTHKNWINNALVRFFLNRLKEDDIYLITASLFAAGNSGHFFGASYAGVTVVIPVFSGKNFAEIVEREKVTVTHLNPTTFQVVRDYLNSTDRRYDLSSLSHLAIGGGQPCSGGQLKEILDYFRIPYTNSSKAYGMAEVASPGTFLLPSDVAAGLKPDATEKERRRLDSVGKSLGNILIRVVDDNDQDVPPGEKGEILIKGNNVMKRYWNLSEATRKALRGGWYHTADMGFFDEDGYLYLVGRKDFLIKSGGFFVSPEEVEKTILQHPAVAEVAVVGVPDKKWGEAVTAAVRLKPAVSCTEEEIREHCRKYLARFQVPKLVDFVDQLPRELAYGKISRQELVNRYKERSHT